MFSPSGWAWIAITSAPASTSACGPASWAAPSAQSRTTRMPGERVVDGADEVGGVLAHRPGVRRHPADVAADGPLPLLAEAPLDGDLDRVVELVPAAGEELDAVVGHRVVRGGEHHAEVGPEGAGEVGDARASAGRRAGARRRRRTRGRPPPRPPGTARRSGCRGRPRPAGGGPRTHRGRRGPAPPRRTGPGPAPRSADRSPGPGPRRCRRVAPSRRPRSISAC